jgi:hypothetical protein
MIMKSYEALHEAISGDTIEFAKRLKTSTSLITKWQEPTTDWSDSGAFNPLDRIEAVIEMAIHKGRSHDQAYAPIYYLAERFGLIAIPIPHARDLKDLSDELMEAIKEFGHLATVSAEAMADGIISRDEAKRIEKEGSDLMRHVAAFMQKANESVR